MDTMQENLSNIKWQPFVIPDKFVQNDMESFGDNKQDTPDKKLNDKNTIQQKNDQLIEF